MKNELNEKKKQEIVLLVNIVTAFITTFTGSALNLSIPNIGQEFMVSASFVGWLVTAYMLASAAFSVPFGRIADITSRKTILIIGIGIFSICSLISAFAWNMVALVVVRALQGFGAAMIFSTNIAILISAYPHEERGKTLGFSSAATYIGLSVGPVIGGFFNHHFGWRSIFLLTFVISAAVFVVALTKLPNDERKSENVSYDMLGTFLYTGMVICLLYGMSSLTTTNLAKLILIIGLVLVAVFVKHELKIEKPIIEIRLFANNIGYTLSNVAALMNYSATFAISYLLSIYFQVVMGYSSQVAGMILVTQPVIQAIMSPQTGKLSDRVSPFKMASFGMGICACCLFFFANLREDTSLWMIITALVAAGVGFAFFATPNTNAVMSYVEPKDYSVASSILSTMRNIGHTSSMAIVTAVVGIYMGSAALSNAEPETLIRTMHTCYLIFTGMCALGTFISLKRK